MKKIIAAVALACTLSLPSSAAEVITIDTAKPTTPFPHFWEHMFGSGRAILSLRDSYRKDLARTQKIVDAQHVRFHAIFHDEVGVYDEDSSGKPVYNWTYVDQIYDGLLDKGVRPFVELSFMPNKLAAASMPHSFWYKQNVSPPKSYEKWGDLVAAFTKHLKERYGSDELAKWYFEVWNEPNIDFWGGEPKQQTYFQLYDAAVKAMKAVEPRLKVGGPATAAASWIDDLIAHCHAHNVPLDFVSTHVYGNDSAPNALGVEEKVPRSDMVARAVKKVHDQVAASAMPRLPIIWSEYNASYMNEVDITDSEYMGPWLANNIAKCDGLTTEMSLWTFSDVFEEQGVAKKPFYGGFGLIAPGGMPKAAFNAMSMLHRLGTNRIPVDSDSALGTRNRDGSLAVAVWNYVEPGTTGSPKTYQIKVTGTAVKSAQLQVLDANHGSALTRWREMGSPDWPSREQTRELLKAAQPPAFQALPAAPELTIELQPNALAILEIRQ